MDGDYLKEMMDLKTLVTKSLEKKGVLARIRAELRANVFQAIEEQDHVTESEGGDSFALLGGCSERAKQMHSTPAGKLLHGLICEYLEWCELERTLRVYSPELNQPRPYSRSELEELLEIKNDKSVAGVSSETRPLLLEVLEGYLKSETILVKDSYAVASSSYPKSRVSTSTSQKSNNGLDIGDEDLRGVLESRLNLSNKGVDQATTSTTNSVEMAVQPESFKLVKSSASNVRTSKSGAAFDKILVSVLDESKDVGKPAGKLSLLGDLPPLRRTGGLAALVPAIGGKIELLTSAGATNGRLDATFPGAQGSSGVRDCSSDGGMMGFLRSDHSWQDAKASRPGSPGRESQNQDVISRDQYSCSTIELKTGRCRKDLESGFVNTRRNALLDIPPKSDDVGGNLPSLGKMREDSSGEEVEEDLGDTGLLLSPETEKPCVTAESSTSSNLEPSTKVSPAWLDRLGADMLVKDVKLAKTMGEKTASERLYSSLSLQLPCGKASLSNPSFLRKKCPSASFYSDSDEDASPW